MDQAQQALGVGGVNDNLGDNYHQQVRNAQGAFEQARADAFGNALGAATGAVQAFTGSMQEISSYFKGEQSGLKTLGDIIKKINDASKIEPPQMPKLPDLFKRDGVIPDWLRGGAPPGWTNFDDPKHRQHSFPRERKPENLAEQAWGQHLPTWLGGHGTGAEPMPTDGPATQTARMPNMPGVSVPSNPAQNYAGYIAKQTAGAVAPQTVNTSLTVNLVPTVNAGNVDGAVKAALSGVSAPISIDKTVNVNLKPNVSGGAAINAAASSAAGAPKMASGGHVFRDGLAYVHQGETITPARAFAYTPPPASSQPVVVHSTLQVDGRRMAQVTTRHMTNAMRMASRGSAYMDTSQYGPPPVDNTSTSAA